MQNSMDILKSTEVYSSKRVNFMVYELYLNNPVIFLKTYMFANKYTIEYKNTSVMYSNEYRHSGILVFKRIHE